MKFNNEKAIYVQIADRLCDEILTGKYNDDERIPSVREYAVLLEVNTNTAVKSYDLLASAGIIYNRRGLGYFVTKGAKDMIMKERRTLFMEEKLPELFRSMDMLGITIDDISKAWNDRKSKNRIHATARSSSRQCDKTSLTAMLSLTT